MWSYYVLRDRLPFFALLIYALKCWKPKLFSDFSDTAGLLLVNGVFFVSYLALLGLVSDIHITEALGLRWTYSAPIEWGIFTLITYLFLTWRTVDSAKASAIAINAASAGGWLYEIPMFLEGVGGGEVIRSSPYNVFYLSFQLISVPVIIYLLASLGAKLTSKVTIGNLIYIIYVLTYLYVPSFRLMLEAVLFNWWQRVPTIVMLSTWILGVRYEA